MERVFVTGKVTDNADPENLGRLKVKLDGFPDAIETDWVRALMPHATSDGGGFVFLPAVDDKVILLSPVYGDDVHQGQLSSMVVLGCLYSGKAKPKFDGEDPKEPIKRITTRSGHQLLFDDGKQVFTIRSVSDNTSIEMDGKATKIIVTAGGAKVTIGKDKAGAIDIDAGSGNITMNGMAVKIGGTQGIELNAPMIKLSGTKIDVAGQAQVNLQAAMINFSGMTNLG